MRLVFALAAIIAAAGASLAAPSQEKPFWGGTYNHEWCGSFSHDDPCHRHVVCAAGAHIGGACFDAAGDHVSIRILAASASDALAKAYFLTDDGFVLAGILFCGALSDGPIPSGASRVVIAVGDVASQSFCGALPIGPFEGIISATFSTWADA